MLELGDMVKILKPAQGVEEETKSLVGKTGSVVRVRRDGYDVQVGKKCWCYTQKELKKI